MTRSFEERTEDEFDKEPDDDEILKELMRSEKTYNWVSDNWIDLQNKFEDQYVAIKDQEIIDHKSSIEELRTLFEADPQIIIEFFPPKKAAMLL